tara:strand:- start:533 stop:1564 length:1032 start_codon:yes stop_codon:yes gene_type:complete
MSPVYSPSNAAYMSEYGPIHGAYGPSAESKFQMGFGQSQALPGLDPSVQRGGNNAGGAWAPNNGASLQSGLDGLDFGEIPPWSGGGGGNIQQITNNFAGGADGVGVFEINSQSLDTGDVSLIKETTGSTDIGESGTTTTLNALKCSDGTVSFSSSGGKIDITASGSGASYSSTATISVSGNDLDGRYSYSSPDFFRDADGGNDDVFVAGTHRTTKFLFGIAAIEPNTTNHVPGDPGYPFTYKFTRVAGDIDASGDECFNLVEVDNSGVSPRYVGGILMSGSGYPSTYSPSPATTTKNTGASSVHRQQCLVFMWKDVAGLIGNAGTHYFQLQIPHDGSCPSSSG